MTINSVQSFRAFTEGAQFSDSAFSRLTREELEFFVSTLKFDEKGNFVTGYFGDLVINHGLSDRDVGALLDLFQIANRGGCLYHGFGDGQGGCWSRLFWWCCGIPKSPDFPGPAS